MVSFTHEQHIICSQTQLNDIAHEQTIICRQLFVGHVVGSRPMERKKYLHQMIIYVIFEIILKSVFQYSNKKCLIQGRQRVKDLLYNGLF